MSIFTLHILGVTISPTYYGLAYALGFILGYHILKHHKKLSIPALDSLLTYIFLGVIVGGRLGYVLFYHFAYFVENPLKIPAIWEGGMSFHGGVIGVVLALYIYAYRKNISVYTIGDEVCSILPIGIGLGRVANYLNGELYGYAGYTGPLGMYVGGNIHFPSPLYEAAGEGLLLYIAVYIAYRVWGSGSGYVSGVFLCGYSIVRLGIEFFRLPDIQVGYLLGTQWLTMGHILTLPMLVGGLYLLSGMYRGNR